MVYLRSTGDSVYYSGMKTVRVDLDVLIHDSNACTGYYEDGCE